MRRIPLALTLLSIAACAPDPGIQPIRMPEPLVRPTPGTSAQR
jgi:hypothetical protein